MAVAGTTEIDMRGLVPLTVASGDGMVWATVHDPTRGTGSQEATVARVDPAAGAVTTVVPVAEGCDAAALAVGNGAVWVGTCDELAPPDSTAGAQVVRVDAASGRVTKRVSLPTRCVAQLAVGRDAVSAGELTLAGQRQRVWRIDPESGALSTIAQLGGDTSLAGVAVTDAGVWTQKVTPDRGEATRTDASTSQAEGSVPEKDAALIGGHGDGVWFRRAEPSVIAQRDAATGAVRTETPVPDVRSAAVGASGAWFQQAAEGSLTITIGRIDPATGAIGPTFSFEGVGPDRTGLPFLGDLSVDESGAWLVYQGRLHRYVVAAPAPPPPPSSTTPPAPSTTAPPGSTSAPATGAPASTTPGTTSSTTK
ncbi:MAG TPA: hypothetical protein VKH17_05970 [Acidimicrobiia bacterium]|nr:hypothetical protein [Acidimicrobiia bacterium]